MLPHPSESQKIPSDVISCIIITMFLSPTTPITISFTFLFVPLRNPPPLLSPLFSFYKAKLSTQLKVTHCLIGIQHNDFFSKPLRSKASRAHVRAIYEYKNNPTPTTFLHTKTVKWCEQILRREFNHFTAQKSQSLVDPNMWGKSWPKWGIQIIPNSRIFNHSKLFTYSNSL